MAKRKADPYVDRLAYRCVEDELVALDEAVAKAERQGFVACDCGRKLRREDDPRLFAAALDEINENGFWTCPECWAEIDEIMDRQWQEYQENTAKPIVEKIRERGFVRCPRCGHEVRPGKDEHGYDRFEHMIEEILWTMPPAFFCPKCCLSGWFTESGEVELVGAV